MTIPPSDGAHVDFPSFVIGEVTIIIVDMTDTRLRIASLIPVPEYRDN